MISEWVNKPGLLLLLLATTPLFAFQPVCDEAVFSQPIALDQPGSFQTVSAQLQSIKVFRANFTQKKKIKVLRRPLRSSGSFLISSEKGLYWRAATPFENIFIITPKALFQKSENADPITIKAEERPVIYGFTRVFLSLFSGDTQQLDKEFELYFSGTPEAWTIGLVPKSKIMGKLIDRIVVCGSETIQQVDFREASGDRTLIDFSDISTEPPRLTEEELARFDF